jgi:hypothetical protein
VPIHTHTQPCRSQQSKENSAMIECNKHEKAKNQAELLLATVSKEISKGPVLVLPLHIHRNLPHSMICPMGIVEQTNYMINGSIITKNRITHDQIFCLLNGSESVNSITDMGHYPAMIYGFCYLRMVHQNISLWHHQCRVFQEDIPRDPMLEGDKTEKKGRMNRKDLRKMLGS